MEHNFEEIANLLVKAMDSTKANLPELWKKTIESAVNNLDIDEEVLAVACSNPVIRGSSSHIYGGLVVFTIKRIMICGSTALIAARPTVSSILIENVSSINPSKGFVLGSIRIETIGNDDIKMDNLSKTEVDRIAKLFTDALHIAKERKKADLSTTVIQQVSSADEIMKFKNLLDAGIITQEEFDAKKKQLLGL